MFVLKVSLSENCIKSKALGNYVHDIRKVN
jgi:hypothetical protein